MVSRVSLDSVTLPLVVSLLFKSDPLLFTTPQCSGFKDLFFSIHDYLSEELFSKLRVREAEKSQIKMETKE